MSGEYCVKVYLNISIDSDSTLPATDDFRSRFLEFDEYSLEVSKNNIGIFPSSSRIRNRCSQESSFAIARSFTRCKEVNYMKRYTSQVRRNDESVELAPSISHKVLESEDSEQDDEELSTFRNPKMLTARQLSLQSQRSVGGNFSSDKSQRLISDRPGFDSTLLSLESLAPQKSTVPLTEEQLAVRQKRIARRRESAKRKAELEKKQTVERLLKINVDDTSKRVRGKGRRIFGSIRNFTNISDSVHVSNNERNKCTVYSKPNMKSNENDLRVVEEQLGTDFKGLTNDENRELIKQNSNLSTLSNKVLAYTPDPLPGYVRSISSVRLTPNCALCLPKMSVDNESSTLGHCGDIFSKSVAIPSPKVKLCAMDCGRSRRYVCSKSGRSLCSLYCYQNNLAKLNDENILVAT